MDITTRVIAQSKVNDDISTGLARYAQVTSINIDGANNGKITVNGRIALMSPTGICMQIESTWEFIRYDRAVTYKDQWVIDTAATYYIAGEDMGGGVLAEGGELKTPESGHFEQVVDKTENLKYSALEQSAIGQGIKQMLGMDLAGAIVGNLWVENNLKQL